MKAHQRVRGQARFDDNTVSSQTELPRFVSVDLRVTGISSLNLGLFAYFFRICSKRTALAGGESDLIPSSNKGRIIV